MAKKKAKSRKKVTNRKKFIPVRKSKKKIINKKKNLNLLKIRTQQMKK